MGGVRQQLMAAVLVAVALMATAAEGYITQKTWGAIRRANRAGPFVGLVVPNTYEMVPVLESPSFVASKSIPNMDIQGRRFRFGTIEGQSVVMVMTGLSMLNAGLTTQMLLSLFRVKGIVHWGIAGNANEDLQIGDVTIPEYWAHVSLWNWQRFGDGKDNELSLEAAGDYTREYGFLNFSDYTVGQSNPALSANQLNSIWYQPEEIFPNSSASSSGAPPWRWRAPPWPSWRTRRGCRSSPSARSPTWPGEAPRSGTRPAPSSTSPRRTPSPSCSSSCRCSARAAARWTTARPLTCEPVATCPCMNNRVPVRGVLSLFPFFLFFLGRAIGKACEP
ncbi:hypothetical protein VPH35_051086 [Triticum aestivum]